MKTIRLLYPDYVSGGLEEYYFGANLLQHILPENPKQPIVKVEIAIPDGRTKKVTKGIYAETEVLAGIENAKKKLVIENPDKVITIGGNCLVSLAPFDFLHTKYDNLGIIWIDAHPDVSTPHDGYPNAHAMVLGSLLGKGASQLRTAMRGKFFNAADIMYVGLQPLHDYQEKHLTDMGVDFKVQDNNILADKEIKGFAGKYDHVLLHFDIDVLDERLFHSTYFANPELVGDGSGGGKMTIAQVSGVLSLIETSTNIVGFTIAEYLPFDAYQLHKMFSGIKLLND